MAKGESEIAGVITRVPDGLLNLGRRRIDLWRNLLDRRHIGVKIDVIFRVIRDLEERVLVDLESERPAFGNIEAPSDHEEGRRNSEDRPGTFP